MNIVYVHKEPGKAAKWQYNKPVVNMTLEAAQMLCTAHHCIIGEDADVPYQAAHTNHPSTIGARQSGQNYAWLYHHIMALGNEYTKRYGKQHLTITKWEDKLDILPGGILENGFEQTPQCLPEETRDKCSVQG